MFCTQVDHSKKDSQLLLRNWFKLASACAQLPNTRRNAMHLNIGAKGCSGGVQLSTHHRIGSCRARGAGQQPADCNLLIQKHVQFIVWSLHLQCIPLAMAMPRILGGCGPPPRPTTWWRHALVNGHLCSLRNFPDDPLRPSNRSLVLATAPLPCRTPHSKWIGAA